MKRSDALPHDASAERAVIGALLAGGELGDVNLEPRDFFGTREAAIFRAIAELAAQGRSVDAVSVGSQMGADDLEAIGGRSTLLEYDDPGVCTANLATYAATVQEKARLRAAIRATTAAQTALYEATRPADELIAEAASSLLAIGDTGKRPTMRLADAVARRLDEYASPTVTAMIPGTSVALHFGDVAVIGGRPGTGKTALLLQAADVWRLRWPVLVLSFEMSISELVDRLVTRATGLPSQFPLGGLNEGERARYAEQCVGLLDDDSLELVQAAGMSEAQVAATIRSFAARGGRAVVLDYLQIACEARVNENADLTRLMRVLQQTAKATGVLLLAASQYSRGAVDGRPALHSLRGSGAIEQEAAVAGLMWTPDVDDMIDRKREQAEHGYLLDIHDPRPLVRITWAKVRHGATATDYLLFDGARMQLEPVDRRTR